MQSQFERLTLENINNGAVLDLFAEEWERLIGDIADVNKPAEKARTIAIEIEVKPDETRGHAAITVRAKTKVPSAIGTKGIAYFSLEGGRVESYVNNFDQGELFGENEEGIINMRKEQSNDG